MINKINLFLIVLLFLSCSKDNSFKKGIWEVLQKEEVSKILNKDFKTEYHIMVLTDRDCAKCFDELELLKDSPTVTNIALFYSKNKKNFLNKLTNRNSKIAMVPLSNLNLVTQLEKYTNRTTPIRITIFKKKVQKIE